MQKLTVYFLLIILPLVVATWGVSQFETPKILLAEAGIQILIFYSILIKRQRWNLRNWYVLSIAALGIISLIDIVFLRTEISFFGNQFRLQGIFLLWHLAAFSFFTRQISLKWIPKIFFLIPILLLLGLIPIFGNNPSGRAIGTLGEPNMLAATAIFFWPFLMPKKFLMTLGLLSGTLVMIFSRSNSGIIALGMQILFLMLTYRVKIPIKFSLLICIVLLVMTLGLPFVDKREDHEDRASIWKISGQAALEQPFLGYGFGNVEEAIRKQATQNGSVLKDVYVDSAHNFLLDYFLSGGLAALGAIMVLVAGTFREFVRMRKVREIVLFLGVLTMMSFNPSGVSTLLAFWWLVGRSQAGGLRDE